MEKKEKRIDGKVENSLLEGVPALKRKVDKRKIAAYLKKNGKNRAGN